MKFTPMGNRVLVLRDKKETMTSSGILLASDGVEESLVGEIVSISEDIEVKLEAGDKVRFGKYAGSEVTLDGEKFLIMNVEDILGREN